MKPATTPCVDRCIERLQAGEAAVKDLCPACGGQLAAALTMITAAAPELPAKSEPEPEVTRYLTRLELAGVRPTTIRCRAGVLDAVRRHLKHSILTASREELETFLARPLSQESRRAYRSHLRCFYEWAVEESVIRTDPSRRIPAFRVPPTVPRPITGSDLDQAINSASGRMRAWLLLMALGGLRCCEVAALRPDDVMQTNEGVLLFLRECKGGGTATVPAHPAVVEALAALPIRDGAWWTCNADSVSAQTNTYLKSLGIPSTAHKLRHYAATSWYRSSGYDLLITAQLMRHTSVRTTQVYAQLDPVRPAEVVGKVAFTLDRANVVA